MFKQFRGAGTVRRSVAGLLAIISFIQPALAAGPTLSTPVLNARPLAVLVSDTGVVAKLLQMRSDSVILSLAGRAAEGEIGTVSLGRKGMDRLFIDYAVPGGHHLRVETSASTGPAIGGPPGNIVSFQYDQLSAIATAGPDQESLGQLLACAANNNKITRLISESGYFLARHRLANALEGKRGVSDCQVEATDCLTSLVTYGVGIGTIISACGFSLGIGCIGLLLAHPIVAGGVAIYCGRAIETCNSATEHPPAR
jgi:hypothetical protein